MSDRYATIEVDEVIKRTDKAALCDIDGEEVWIPLSQIEDPDDFDEGDTVSLQVTRWFVEREGLEEVL